MKRPTRSSYLIVALTLTLTLLGTTCSPSQTTNNAGDTQNEAESRGDAVIIAAETPDTFSHFTVTGKNADFGRYIALGELAFAAGQEAGVLREGIGTAVLKAENSQQIVADVTCKVFTDGVDFTFHWRDSVTFSNGSTVSNTGAFVDQKPPGLAVSRTRLSAVYFDGLCCVLCCTPSGFCGSYCNFCGGAAAECPTGSTKTR